MVLLKIVFILLLFIFPLGEIFRIDFGNGIVVKPMDIGVSLLIVLWLLFKLKKRQVVKQKFILFPMLIFAAIGGFSLLINFSYLSLNQFFSSSMYLIRWIFYAGIFFVVSDFDLDFKKRIVKILIIVGSLIVGLGYLQYFFYSDAKHLIYLGWDEHMYRMFSTFLDPNFAGTFFVLFFLFISDIFFKKKSTMLGLILIFTLGAIFLTFSRTALIMLIASSSLLFIRMNKKILFVLILGITILVLLMSSRYFNVENINLFRTFSASARLETSSNALKIIKDYPFFGVGFNTYRYVQLRYGFRNDRSLIASHADSGVDNSLLFVLATTGLVGFFSYLFLWFKILKRYWLMPVLASCVLGLLLSSLFINSLFYTPIMFWMWVMLGVTEKK